MRGFNKYELQQRINDFLYFIIGKKNFKIIEEINNHKKEYLINPSKKFYCLFVNPYYSDFGDCWEDVELDIKSSINKKFINFIKNNKQLLILIDESRNTLIDIYEAVDTIYVFDGIRRCEKERDYITTKLIDIINRDERHRNSQIMKFGMKLKDTITPSDIFGDGI